nr:hypothetical protein [Tanacetum cinerariifolium]
MLPGKVSSPVPLFLVVVYNDRTSAGYDSHETVADVVGEALQWKSQDGKFSSFSIKHEWHFIRACGNEVD